MELETAARRHLLSHGPITNLVGDRVWKWRIQHRNSEGEPASLEGTGYAAIVVARAGGWGTPIASSAEYPLLRVDCFSDHSRNPDGTAAKFDREERAMAVYREVDRFLHRPSMEHVAWAGDFYTEGCLRQSEPGPADEFEGVAMVRVFYAVKTFH